MLDLAAADCRRARRPHRAHPRPHGLRRLRPRHLPAPRSAATAPGILVMGHVDTVHPSARWRTLPFRREGDRAYGPGIHDMKGGNYLALEALRQLARAGDRDQPARHRAAHPRRGSRQPQHPRPDRSRSRAAQLVLVPEPAQPDGGVVTGRYAIARFDLDATGRPSHAGARLAEGRSAIREMAASLIAIEAMTSAGLHLQRRRDPRRPVGELRRRPSAPARR